MAKWLTVPLLVLAAWAAAASGIYVGGQFTAAGGATASNVARWTGSPPAWTPLGTGTNAIVESLVWYQDRLVVGGAFTSAGNVVNTRGIAAWSPAAAQWQSLTSLALTPVQALLVSGDTPDVLYVGGSFAANGVVAAGIALYDGTSWSSPGTGVSNGGAVFVLGSFGGALVAAGRFTTMDAVTASSIAQRSDDRWSPLGTGVTGGNGEVYDLAVYLDRLFVGGLFTTAGGLAARGIAVWSGTAWSTVGAGVSTNGEVTTFSVVDDLLYVGGFFTTMNNVAASNLAIYNRSVWVYVTGANDGLYALAHSDPSALLYAGGAFTTIGGVSAVKIGAYDLVSRGWSALSSGITGFVRAIAPDSTPRTPPGECALEDVEWRAQYYLNSTTLVEDVLAFVQADGSFHQNITAFPFQDCLANWIVWDGDYDVVNATTVLMSFMRCTPSSRGCVICEATRIEYVGFSFGDGCGYLTLHRADGEVHTYFPSTRRSY